jgi:hypothetical protein
MKEEPDRRIHSQAARSEYIVVMLSEWYSSYQLWFIWQREIYGITVDLCTGGNIEKSDTSFRKESSIFQVSDKVKGETADSRLQHAYWLHLTPNDFNWLQRTPPDSRHLISDRVRWPFFKDCHCCTPMLEEMSYYEIQFPKQNKKVLLWEGFPGKWDTFVLFWEWTPLIERKCSVFGNKTLTSSYYLTARGT